MIRIERRPDDTRRIVVAETKKKSNNVVWHEAAEIGAESEA